MELQKKTILITVDLEDWFQVENFKKYIPVSKWDTVEWRFENNTRKLLEIFAEYKIKVTFFVLAWNAERASGLIREIKAQGHEVASHGYSHQLCRNLSYDAIYKDILKSKIILEDIIETPVYGYRAPSFSINNNVVNVLKELGYAYDCSYNSFDFNSRYGKLNLSRFRQSGIAYKDSEGFYELPISNLKIGNIIFPWGGGGYFRFYPKFVFRAGVARILDVDHVYLFYLHPWEIDRAQPFVQEANTLYRFRHYANINSCLRRLKDFFTKFQDCFFNPCSEYIDSL